MQRSEQVGTVLRLLESMEKARSPRGETQVQKTAFLLDRGLGFDLEFDFIIYRYGPYSFPLNTMLGRLQSSYLVDLVPNPSGSGSTLGLTRSGMRVVDELSHAVEIPSDRLEFAAQKFGRLGVAKLEQLATALYVSKRQPNDASRDLGPNPSVEDRATELTRLKPHIAIETAMSAVATIDGWLDEARRLGLVANQETAHSSF